MAARKGEYRITEYLTGQNLNIFTLSSFTIMLIIWIEAYHIHVLVLKYIYTLESILKTWKKIFMKWLLLPVFIFFLKLIFIFCIKTSRETVRRFYLLKLWKILTRFKPFYKILYMHFRGCNPGQENSNTRTWPKG